MSYATSMECSAQDLGVRFEGLSWSFRARAQEKEGALTSRVGPAHARLIKPSGPE